MPVSRGGSQNQGDLRFNAVLEDNVSPQVDQIVRKLQQLGASKHEIKIVVRAYDEATQKAHEVRQLLERMPKNVRVTFDVERARAMSEIHAVRAKAEEIAKKPITMGIHVKSNIEQEMAKIESKMDSLRTRMVGTGTTLGSGFAGSQFVQQAREVGGTVGNTVASGIGLPVGIGAGIGVGAAGAIAADSFRLNMQREQDLQALQATLKSQQEAVREFSRVTTYAKTTPFNQPDVLQSAIQMRNYGINPWQQGGLPAVGNIAAGTGQPLDRVTYAVIGAMQRGDYRMLRNIGVRMDREDFQPGGRFAGMSPQEALGRVSEIQYSGATQNYARTFQGLQSNVQDVARLNVREPIGASAFNTGKNLIEQVNKRISGSGPEAVDFQRQLQSAVGAVDMFVSKMIAKVKELKSTFDTYFKQPLKEIVQSLANVAAVFAKAFGGTTLMVVKTLADAFVTLVKPLADLAEKAPGLIKVLAAMKAIQFLGGPNMLGGAGQMASGLNPLSMGFGPGNVVGGARSMATALPLIGGFLVAQNLLERKQANEGLRDSFNEFGAAGEAAANKLIDKYGKFGSVINNSATDMKKWAAAAAQNFKSVEFVGESATQRAEEQAKAVDQMAQLRSRLDEQGFRESFLTLTDPAIKAQLKAFAEGGRGEGSRRVTGDEAGAIGATVQQEAADYLRRSFPGEDLEKKTEEILGSYAAYEESLRKRVGKSELATLSQGPEGATAANVLGQYIQQSYKNRTIPDEVVLGKTFAGDVRSPQELTNKLITESLQPSAELLQEFSQKQREEFARNMGPMTPSRNVLRRAVEDVTTLPEEDQILLRGRAGRDQVSLREALMSGQKTAEGRARALREQNRQAQEFFSGLPEGYNQYTLPFAQPSYLQTFTVGSGANRRQVSPGVDMSQLGTREGIMNQLMDKADLSQSLERRIEEARQRYGELETAAKRVALAQEGVNFATENYTHDVIVPAQRALEDYSRVMLKTSRAMEDSSYKMARAQFGMSKFTDGFVEGTNAVNDHLHELDMYQKQLQYLQLQQRGMMTDLTTTTITQGYSSVVKPVMGFGLEVAREQAERRRAMAELEGNSLRTLSNGQRVGDFMYDLEKAMRTGYKGVEYNSKNAIKSVKDYAGVITEQIFKQHDLQKVQHEQTLVYRRLDDAQYAAQVGLRGFIDAQDKMRRAAYEANRELQIQDLRISDLTDTLEEVRLSSKFLSGLLGSTANQEGPGFAKNIQMMLRQLGFSTADSKNMGKTLGGLGTGPGGPGPGAAAQAGNFLSGAAGGLGWLFSRPPAIAQALFGGLGVPTVAGASSGITGRLDAVVKTGEYAGIGGLGGLLLGAATRRPYMGRQLATIGAAGGAAAGMTSSGVIDEAVGVGATGLILATILSTLSAAKANVVRNVGTYVTARLATPVLQSFEPAIKTIFEKFGKEFTALDAKGNTAALRAWMQERFPIVPMNTAVKHPLTSMRLGAGSIVGGLVGGALGGEVGNLPGTLLGGVIGQSIGYKIAQNVSPTQMFARFLGLSDSESLGSKFKSAMDKYAGKAYDAAGAVDKLGAEANKAAPKVEALVKDFREGGGPGNLFRMKGAERLAFENAPFSVNSALRATPEIVALRESSIALREGSQALAALRGVGRGLGALGRAANVATVLPFAVYDAGMNIKENRDNSALGVIRQALAGGLNAATLGATGSSEAFGTIQGRRAQQQKLDAEAMQSRLMEMVTDIDWRPVMQRMNEQMVQANKLNPGLPGMAPFAPKPYTDLTKFEAEMEAERQRLNQQHQRMRQQSSQYDGSYMGRVQFAEQRGALVTPAKENELIRSVVSRIENRPTILGENTFAGTGARNDLSKAIEGLGSKITDLRESRPGDPSLENTKQVKDLTNQRNYLKKKLKQAQDFAEEQTNREVAWEKGLEMIRKGQNENNVDLVNKGYEKIKKATGVKLSQIRKIVRDSGARTGTEYANAISNAFAASMPQENAKQLEYLYQMLRDATKGKSALKGEALSSFAKLAGQNVGLDQSDIMGMIRGNTEDKQISSLRRGLTQKLATGGLNFDEARPTGLHTAADDKSSKYKKIQDKAISHTEKLEEIFNTYEEGRKTKNSEYFDDLLQRATKHYAADTRRMVAHYDTLKNATKRGGKRVTTEFDDWMDANDTRIKAFKADYGITEGRAHGGLIEADPHKVGPGYPIRVAEEGHPEMIIPLAPHRRERAKMLVNQTKSMIGFANGGMASAAARTERGGDGSARSARRVREEQEADRQQGQGSGNRGSNERNRSSKTTRMDRVMAEANRIEALRLNYLYGGGHDGSPVKAGSRIDCSAAVSALLQAGGYYRRGQVEVSGAMMNIGKPGRGAFTIVANPNHVFAILNGRAWGTSRQNPGGGPGWHDRGPAPGDAVRHMPGTGSTDIRPTGAGGAGSGEPAIPEWKFTRYKDIINGGVMGKVLNQAVRKNLKAWEEGVNKYLQGGGSVESIANLGTRRKILASVFGSDASFTDPYDASDSNTARGIGYMPGYNMRDIKWVFGELGGNALGNLPLGYKLHVQRGRKAAILGKYDVGPAYPGRSMDIWVTAARHLNFLKQGLGDVWIREVPQSAPLGPTAPKFGRAAGGLAEADPYKNGKGYPIRVAEEGHPEMIIPLAPHRRDRARALVNQTKAMLGFKDGGQTKEGPTAKTTRGGVRAGRTRYERIKDAAWNIHKRNIRYRWGGGHPFPTGGGLDCSGALAIVLRRAGYLGNREPAPHSSGFGRFGTRGKSGLVTIYYNNNHVFARIAGKTWQANPNNPGRKVGYYGGNLGSTPYNVVRLNNLYDREMHYRYANGGLVPGYAWGGWHAKGGDFRATRPTLFGVGEAGPERVSIRPEGKSLGGGEAVKYLKELVGTVSEFKKTFVESDLRSRADRVRRNVASAAAVSGSASGGSQGRTTQRMSEEEQFREEQVARMDKIAPGTTRKAIARFKRAAGAGRRAIRDARSRDSDGGKRITKKERRAINKAKRRAKVAKKKENEAKKYRNLTTTELGGEKARIDQAKKLASQALRKIQKKAKGKKSSGGRKLSKAEKKKIAQAKKKVSSLDFKQGVVTTLFGDATREYRERAAEEGVDSSIIDDIIEGADDPLAGGLQSDEDVDDLYEEGGLFDGDELTLGDDLYGGASPDQQPRGRRKGKSKKETAAQRKIREAREWRRRHNKGKGSSARTANMAKAATSRAARAGRAARAETRTARAPKARKSGTSEIVKAMKSVERAVQQQKAPKVTVNTRAEGAKIKTSVSRPTRRSR